MFKYIVSAALLLATAPCAFCSNLAAAASTAQATFHAYIYRFTAYTPSRGKVAEREVAIVAMNHQDAEYKAALARLGYLKENSNGETGATVTCELIAVR